mgnify:CR=1 FL=1|tara:strand:- start:1134 stop:1295 length:162 start_codon:yes stop_codon:yes gene_type:complete
MNRSESFNKLKEHLNENSKDIYHSRKYEDRVNLNASNIINGIWEAINTETSTL